MRTFIKQALCLCLSLTLALGWTPAEANAVSDAFNSLLSGANVSINSPGNFSSEAAGAFVGGGLGVRFPTREIPQIINVVPFSYSAGCGGISFGFGGFSFINGSEIKSLIQSIAQDSIGMAVELVMTTLCGPCASVMQVMNQLALEASQHSISSCEIAQNLVNKMGGYLPTFGPRNPSIVSATARTACGLFGSINGLFQDYKSTKSSCNSVGQDVTNMTNWIGQATASLTSGQQAKAICANSGACNTTWNLLNHTPLGETQSERASVYNQRIKLLLMNIMGTDVTIPSAVSTNITGATGSSSTKTASPSASASNGSAVASTQVTATGSNSPGLHYRAPTLGNLFGKFSEGVSMGAVYKLFMCGTQQPTGLDVGAQSVYNWYCTPPVLQTVSETTNSAGKTVVTSTSFSLANQPIWLCSNGPTASGVAPDAYDQCRYVVGGTIGNSPLEGSGYLPMVANLLEQGVLSVQENKPISNQLISLIQEVPVPLYQAINVAAVYPDAGENLIDVMSVEVAELLTFANIQEIVHEASKFQQSSDLSAAQIDRVYGLLGAMRAGTIERKHEILAQMTLENQLMQQIRLLNVAMQRNVLPPQLLLEHNYSVALSKATAGTAP